MLLHGKNDVEEEENGEGDTDWLDRLRQQVVIFVFEYECQQDEDEAVKMIVLKYLEHDKLLSLNLLWGQLLSMMSTMRVKLHRLFDLNVLL